MRTIFNIGHNDLRLFLKRKSSFVWLFVMPFVFVYFMGRVNSGPGDPYNRSPRVRIESADTNFLARVLLKELGEQDLRVVKPDDKEDVAGTLVIPAELTANALNLKQTKVRFRSQGGQESSDGAILELRLVRALVSLNGHILETVPQPLTEDNLRKVAALPNPVSLDSRFAGRKPVPSSFNFSLPGNLVMYLMMNLLIFGGILVAAERRNGVIKRMMMNPVTKGSIVLGKIYGLMLLGVVQILFFLVAGKYALGVNLGANLPAVFLTLLVFAWVAGSFGVLVGSLVASEDRVVGISVLLALLMAAVGGCWWPMEIAPPAQKMMALFLPTGWALKALNQLISFGSDFGAVLLPIAVLSGFALVATFFAARYFRN